MKTSIPAVCAALFALAATACGDQAPESAGIELAQPESAVPVPPAAEIATPSPVEGWQDSSAEDPSLLADDFSVAGPDDGAVTAGDLRERWTILAFWGLWSEDSIADVRYMQALRSAAGQDPDLDFIAIHTPPLRPAEAQPSEAPYGAYLSLQQGLTDQGAPFPTAEDIDGSAARALNITTAPTYILVGPDLAIEARRGAIRPNDSDGIKSMIRGVHEIRRQIELPN